MVNDTLVSYIPFFSFRPACDFAHICVLHHQVHSVVRLRRVVFVPDEHFYDIIMLELTPELHLVHDLVLQPPDSQSLRRLHHSTQRGRLVNFQSIRHCLIRCCIVAVGLDNAAKGAAANLVFESQEVV